MMTRPLAVRRLGLCAVDEMRLERQPCVTMAPERFRRSCSHLHPPGGWWHRTRRLLRGSSSSTSGSAARTTRGELRPAGPTTKCRHVHLSRRLPTRSWPSGQATRSGAAMTRLRVDGARHRRQCVARRRHQHGASLGNGSATAAADPRSAHRFAGIDELRLTPDDPATAEGALVTGQSLAEAAPPLHGGHVRVGACE